MKVYVQVMKRATFLVRCIGHYFRAHTPVARNISLAQETALFIVRIDGDLLSFCTGDCSECLDVDFDTVFLFAQETALQRASLARSVSSLSLLLSYTGEHDAAVSSAEKVSVCFSAC